MDVGEGGEWPLFLDVFVEHAVEEVAARRQTARSARSWAPTTCPTRSGSPPPPPPGPPDEAGTRWPSAAGHRHLRCPRARGRARHLAGRRAGLLLRFAPDIPAGNLRGVVTADAEGRFEIRTIQPAPYQLPTDAHRRAHLRRRWHPWRPAHLHLLVSAPAGAPVTTQLYFAGGEWLDSDVAEAVKPELVLDPTDAATAPREVTYDFVLENA